MDERILPAWSMLLDEHRQLVAAYLKAVAHGSPQSADVAKLLQQVSFEIEAVRRLLPASPSQPLS